MILIHDIVRFDKTKNADVYKTFGKRGRKFEVVAVKQRPYGMFYALKNTVTGSVVRWIGESLIKKVD